MPTLAVPAVRKPGGVTGAQLVGLVLDNWSHLPDLQFRTLIRMAHTALDGYSDDGKPPRRYYGGYVAIAKTWRTPFPDDDGTPEARRKRKNILSDVRKVMRALEAAGAVKVIDTGKPPGPGNSQSFMLLV